MGPSESAAVEDFHLGQGKPGLPGYPLEQTPKFQTMGAENLTSPLLPALLPYPPPGQVRGYLLVELPQAVLCGVSVLPAHFLPAAWQDKDLASVFPGNVLGGAPLLSPSLRPSPKAGAGQGQRGEAGHQDRDSEVQPGLANCLLLRAYRLQILPGLTVRRLR